MTGIGRTLLFPAQMTCIDHKTRDVRPKQPVILDLDFRKALSLQLIVLYSVKVYTLFEK